MSIYCNETLTTEEYRQQRLDMILWAEENGVAKIDPYIDSQGYATIGVGFKIDSNWRAILLGLGLDPNAQPGTAESLYVERIMSLVGKDRTFTETGIEVLRIDLNRIMTQRAYDPAVPGVAGVDKRWSFEFKDINEIYTVFEQVVETQETILNNWLGPISIPNSDERTALLSLTYNNLIGFKDKQQTIRKSQKLWDALNTGNRAEAWFEIRYNSNGGASASVGIAKRRILESEMFGLYDNSASVSLSEAKQVYQMLLHHRPDIITQESLYGTRMSDGTTSGTQGNAVTLAQNDYASLFSVRKESFSALAASIGGLACATYNKYASAQSLDFLP